MIARNIYLSHFKQYLNADLIKVIIGQRRVGKTVFLQQIKQLYLDQGYKDEDIILIDKELLVYNHITDYTHLYEATKAYKIIMIDEIQDITQREKAVRSLFAEKNHQIVITGSNSNLLGGELATYLSGRYISLYMGSYTLSEFILAHGYTDVQSAWRDYLQFGGMPFFAQQDFSKHKEYYSMLLDTILMRDICQRFSIREPLFLIVLLRYLASTLGGLFSSTSIEKAIKQYAKISRQTITDYVYYITESITLHAVMREDIRGKNILADIKKYYFTDIGLRNYLVGGLGKDNIAGVLENIVFNHLRIRGWQVTVGVGRQEIDFIAKKHNKTIYIQVAYKLDSPDTRQREFGALIALSDARPKYVISMEDYGIGYDIVEGINYMHIIDFCLQKELL